MRKAKEEKVKKIRKESGKVKNLKEKIKKYILRAFFYFFFLLYMLFLVFFRVSEKFPRSVCEFSLIQTLNAISLKATFLCLFIL